ncbi:MAG: leucine-rich repeat domain-containing protein [Methylococcales bacterium]|nr:leucine-rich repeat domain-containing protein [Methylococcales bacterium]
MSDLDIIKALEKQIGEELRLCLYVEIMNTHARGCYVLNDEQHVIGLNLQNYKLTQCYLVKSLLNLTKLNLTLNKIVELQPLKKLNQLDELNLQKNEINDIGALKSLKNLKSLNLQANDIIDIKVLSHLKNLKKLNLSSNPITCFEPLKTLGQLTHLDLSDNQINSLSILSTMNELTELDLRFNKISNITELADHNKLTKLFLSSNQIDDIHPLIKLTALTELHLNANKIKTIHIIENLNLLRLLDLRANRIDDISVLKKLTALTHLHLESNEISDISVLKDLTKLTQLNLRGNQISCINSLKELKFLTHLYLSDNQITILPKWILNFNLAIKWSNGGHGISVIANPIESPPPDVIREGNRGIKNFFESQQERALNKVKVLIVGDLGVGKTSLSKALRNLPFESQPLQTLGINIDTWEHDEICVNLWDFGGDPCLLPTHKLFFSQHSLYILVLDNRKQRHEERWLRRIEQLGENSLILIVLNKFDEENSYDLQRDYLLHRYKGLRGIYPVSSSQGVGLDVFKQGLVTAYQHVPSFRKPLSLSAFYIKEALEKQQKNNVCLAYETYTDICYKHGLKEPKMQKNLLQLLHDLGKVVYFKELTPDIDYIFEPNWLINGLYAITTTNLISDDSAELALDDVSITLKIIENANYSPKEQNYLMTLLKRFYLSCPIDESRVLIPQRLREQPLDINFDDSEALQFQIQYNFLDELFIFRFITQFYAQINFDKSSRTCFLLTETEFNCSALIEVDYHHDLIDLKIKGENPRDYYATIRKNLYKKLA